VELPKRLQGMVKLPCPHVYSSTQNPEFWAKFQKLIWINNAELLAVSAEQIL
jgi:hypothetical protein